jgi:serine/threonine-protein kinase
MADNQGTEPPTVNLGVPWAEGAPVLKVPNVSGSIGSPTAGEVFDKSDLERNRVTHLHGTIGPLCNIGATALLGGDHLARLIFCVGMAVVSSCNFYLYRLTRSAERYQARANGIVWLLAMAAMQTTYPYWGAFSAAVIVAMLATASEAIKRERWLALGTAYICIGGYLVTAIPITLGWLDDVGFLPSLAATTGHRIMAEVLVVASLISAYVFGRSVRGNAAGALSELETAKRMLGDREQALAEVAAEAVVQRRINEGRWTNHTFGQWRVGLVLGRGAMGEVYEAVGANGEPAALKLLNAGAASSREIVERFQREMVVAAKLESPHIVKVFELSPPDAPVPYIVMERLAGVDLATRLRGEKDNRLSGEELERLVTQVARGLEVARVASVVHRDLKPHNLIDESNAGWKILDFGVAKVMDTSGTLTGEGIVGTPQYMAPEQAAGRHVTHLADVYALGAIVYRCVTGRSPFKGVDYAELVYQVVHAPPVRPSELGALSKSIEDVLAVAMAKDPRKRFPSALAFAQAFAAAQQGRPPALDVPDKAWASVA